MNSEKHRNKFLQKSFKLSSNNHIKDDSRNFDNSI